MRELKKENQVSRRLLSLEEAAEYAAVSYWTMRDFVIHGFIAYIQLPDPNLKKKNFRRILIDKKDLDAFIESYRVKAVSE